MLVHSGARVVTVASMVHKRSRKLSSPLDLAVPPTDAKTRGLYDTSKLCNILFSNEVHRRYNQFVLRSASSVLT